MCWTWRLLTLELVKKQPRAADPGRPSAAPHGQSTGRGTPGSRAMSPPLGLHHSLAHTDPNYFTRILFCGINDSNSFFCSLPATFTADW